jgi:two-component system, OmpR family, response regulator
MDRPPDQSTPMEATVPHVLCVDDEVEILDLLFHYLSRQGVCVSVAANGDEMRRILASEPIDLVLLDLGLPGEDGLSLTRHLREHWNGSVIIVSGRGDAVDRVVGLELGADDYVTKPFDLRELLARIRSVMRRAPARSAAPASRGRRVAAFAGYRLDLDARTLRDRDGCDIELTTGEFDLLRVFVEQPNRVLSRDALMNSLHGREAGPYDRAIDMQIGRLRRKIEADPERPALIKSVRGAGYLFVPTVEDSQ